ncbi:TonB-dependent receptor plug domain-containing protein [Pseudoalteromonas denitrificans]|uniref:Outer membrane receptor for ferrienterochelin and colicins n=1 Tax=Pseudoalteromonas denitrificans DSM 6059 TaxID=1123010 RepID=A0A1I1LHG9_9GAMM|nr:TonB-dependent receptor [Pseudoalteromonas denitrificans]SFC72637.1 Outer membrane receptor for ferrienterochelin and colicins [Pseudoalteromonas denitrificans DSM 6059]
MFKLEKLSFFIGLSLSANLWATESDNKDVFLLSLEELINTPVEAATKTKESAEKLPAVITVITAQDIQQYGYNSIAEVMRHVTGFIDNYDLALHNFGVRGINSGVRSGSRTVKFMIDGTPIAFRTTSQNFIDQELIPMIMIDKVEVIRGPGSALYGANAFLGVVNIVTKSVENIQSQGITANISTSKLENAGSGYHASLIGGQSAGKFEYSAGLSLTSEDRLGIKLPRHSPNYLTFENATSITTDDYHALNIYARSKYQISEHSDVKVTGYFQRLNIDNTFTDLNALSGTGPSRIGYDNYFFKLNFQKTFNNQFTLSTFGSFSEGDTTDDDKVELGADSFYLTRRTGYKSFDFGAELKVALSEQHNLLIGIETRNDDQKLETFNRVERLSGIITPLTHQKDKKIHSDALFAQYQFQFNDYWNAILGYRIDNDSIINKQESYRVGLVGQLPWDMSLKMLSGSAFQTPSPELLFRESGQAGDIIGNPNLRAQKATTNEISLSAPISANLHITTTLYQTKVDDLVTFNSNSVNLFAENSTKSETKGLELETRFQWHNFSGYFNYFYQDTFREPNPNSLYILQYQKSGELFPKQAANLGLSYYYPDAKLTLSLNNRWLDSRPASTLNILEAKGFYELDAYIDGTLSLTTSALSLIKGKKTQFKFQIRDLYDSNYVDPGFGGIEFPSLGRRFSLSIQQSF